MTIERGMLQITSANTWRPLTIIELSSGNVVHRRNLQALDGDERDALVEWVNGTITWAEVEEAFRAMPSWQFYQGVIEFEFGAATYARPDLHSPWEVSRLSRNMSTFAHNTFLDVPLLQDMPPQLPYSNVMWNAGTREECVLRWLGPEFTPPREMGTSANAIMAHARSCNITVRLYDAIGGIIQETVSTAPGRYPMFQAISYWGHVYPLMNDMPPMRIESFPSHRVFYYDDTPNILTQVVSDPNVAVFRINDTMYWRDGTDFEPTSGSWVGRWRKDMPMTELDMLMGIPADQMLAEAEDAMPFPLLNMIPSSPMEENLRRRLWRCTNPLMYANSMALASSTEKIAFDIQRCYHTAAMTITRMWEGNPFARWEPLSADYDIAGEPAEGVLYQIETLFWESKVPKTLGLCSNIVMGAMVYLLEEWMGCEIPLTARLRMCPEPGQTSVWTHDLTRSYRNLLGGMNHAQRKKFNVIVGICGKLESVEMAMFPCPPQEDEQNYYRSRYDATISDGLVRVTANVATASNRAVYYMQIIHHARLLVFEKMLEVKRLLRKEPVRIMVDSLTYECPVAFDHVLLQDIFAEDPEHRGVKWLEEDVKQTGLTVRWKSVNMLQPDVQQDQFGCRNITFIGAPGTGKTHSALALMPDLILAYTNARASQLNGQTIHSVFGYIRRVTVGEIASKVAGKLVFVDEAGMIPRSLYGTMMEAYRKYNVSFIFAMDPNQLAPVGECPVPLTEFHGKIIRLTDEHRNEPALVELREAVQSGGFVPSPERTLNVMMDAAMLPLDTFHFCATNEYVGLVNRAVMLYHNISFGSTMMRYIMLVHKKSQGFFKGQLVRLRRFVDNTERWVHDGDEKLDEDPPVARTMPRMGNDRAILGPAHAMTVHAAQGMTIADSLIVLHQFHHAFASSTHGMNYTAVTRAKKVEQIYFCP